MPKILTQQQVEQYRQQGFLSPIDVMSKEEASRYAQQLQAAEVEYPQELNAENRNNPHLAFGFLDQLAHHPVILDAVEDLIGPDFALWGSVLFIKEPETRHYVSWHQDATYVGISPHDYVTPWLALTPSDRETGCMSMIPGSHRDDIQPHLETFHDDNILTRGQAIQEVDESVAVDLILRPGQMSLHHCRVIHGSQPNRSKQRRVGFALQGYVPAGGRQYLGANYWLPIRGNFMQADFIELERPASDMDPQALGERRKANQNWADILYQGAGRKRAY
ncbi:MAG: phytanoyl-CoA dioxygenase family protein [Gammaproteobacteria bacterium]